MNESSFSYEMNTKLHFISPIGVWRTFVFGKIACMILAVLPLYSVADFDNGFGVPSSSVVVTPIGYEKKIKLPTGDEVLLYPDALSHDVLTNCHAVLFQILGPRQHLGKRFVLRHSGCECSVCTLRTTVTNLYQVGEIYEFANSDTVSNILCSTYEVRQPRTCLKMERDWGTRLYCTETAIDERLGELHAERLMLAALLKDYKVELVQLSAQPSLRRKRHALKCQIVEIEQRLTNEIPKVHVGLLKRKEWLFHH